MKKTIITSFFTTINFDMFLRSIASMTYRLPYLRVGKDIDKLEQNLLRYLSEFNYSKKKIISFYNARSALYHGLKMCDIKPGDEIIVQAYTCVSVINAILQTGAKPVYVDIEADTLNINPKIIERKITQKTKVIIVQHTFGNPAKIQEIISIAKKYNLYILEDCAHSLGAEYRGVKVGNFGDLSIFSFGRDKVISTVNGGFLVINNDNLFTKVYLIKKQLNLAPISLVLKNLVYIKVSFFAKLFYDFFGLGKAIIRFSRKIQIIPEVLEKQEKSCASISFFYKYPNSLAYIGLKELEKLDYYNSHRIKLAKIYQEKLRGFQTILSDPKNKNIYLRLTYFFDKSEKLVKEARKQNIIFGDWYRQVIAPSGVDYKKALYEFGTCPVAEDLASKTINLPNHIDIKEKDVEKVVNFIGNFYSKY